MSVFSSTADRSKSPSHWQQLAILLRNSPVTARSLLRRPPPPGIPSGKILTEITKSAQQQGLAELLEKHLLAGCLLTRGTSRGQWPRSVRDSVEQLFPGGGEFLQAGSWIQIPILTVQGENARIVSMLLGLLPDTTDCRIIGSPAPDTHTMKAVCSACRAAGQGQGLVCWFLQQGDDQPVYGKSLTLPVALGCTLLSRSLSWPEGLYATGELKSDGTIVPVDHVLEKYQSVALSCGLFLAPVDRDLASAGNQSIHACTNLDEACFSALLYSSGITAAEISLYQACWISSSNFFKHLHELPPAIVVSDRADDFFRQARDEPDNHLPLLSKCFSRCSQDRQRGQIMANLFTPDDILNLAGSSPTLDFAAFNWCLAAIAFHNHSGQIRESSRWSSCTEALRSRVELTEIGKSINHAFVCRRFNRYDFRPDPTRELAAALEQEEQKQKIYPAGNALLGALYGTLAQNCGFCGPSFLGSLLEMTDRARQAFGRKYYHETKRLLNYEIYGYLDAGNTAQASLLLGEYLGPAESGNPDTWLLQAEKELRNPDMSGPFRAALVTRLLSEIGHLLSQPLITENLSLICRQHGHPWQLIALNFGRMAVNAGHLEEAGLLLLHSLQICLADSDTMHPMGLLALSELHAAGLAKAHDYQNAQDIQDKLRQTDRLNIDHFQSILRITDAEDLLHTVTRQRSHLFPFSYR